MTQNKNLLSYRFLPIMLFAIFFLSTSFKAKADSTFLLCVNETQKTYVALLAEACPMGYIEVPSDFDFSNYSPISSSEINNGGSGTNGSGGNGSGGTATTTIIATTSQNNLNNNNQPVIEYQNYEIDIDPSLMYGPFLTLDIQNYPFCVSLTKDLSYGSKDATSKGEVSILQAYLTDRGFLESGATGYFGRATEIAVKKFEYLNQIQVNGVVRRDFRDVLKELTCQKYQKISYIDKPIATNNYSTANSTVLSNQNKKVVIPTTKVVSTSATKVVIPTTVASTNYVSVTPAPASQNIISGPTLDNSRLSSPFGALSLTKRNNLYFTFLSSSQNPTICINIIGTDCSLPTNNLPIREGVNGSSYEAINIGGKWSFTIYGGSVWGAAGSRANIYLRDNAFSNFISIYTVSVTN